MPGETEHYEVNKRYKERENIIILMAYFIYHSLKRKEKGLDEDEAKPRKA